jgi:type IV secretion system protein VirD4
MSKKKLSKLLALYLPYVVIGLLATNLGEAWRLAAGKELGDKIVSLMDTLPAAFSNPLPSLHLFDLFIGLCCGAGMRLAVYLKGKNAKKYRHGMEYGSARWGGPKDIEPFMAPKFEDNIILTKTERLMMSNRPPDPKNSRNKNVLVVGGSGSGKTRFFIKPNLLQCDSKNFPVSFVVTDPKGTIVLECGQAMLKNGYKVKILNTINFKKSMHYNPFSYVHSEKDILKLVTTLMTNTKGEGSGGDPFWEKSERLLLTALIAYLHYEAPVEEQNFATLLEMLNTMQVLEDDEEYQNPVDLLFEELAKKKPNSFAGRQYKLYKLAAGKTAKSILISCGARLAPFDIQELRDLTMYDELALDTLGDKKMALFLIMSDTDSTFNFLISMVYTQLFNLLCDKADDVYSGKLPIHVRCLIDECANIGQIPNLEKLVATIRSREISACLVLQARSQLKAIYKDNADTIVGNMDSQIFLGGSEPTTLKDLSEMLGKETIDAFNTSDTRGNSPSYGTTFQKMGHELLSRDELAVLDGGKCILQLRGVRPFLSDKYDLTQHPNYKLTSDYDPKNTFDIEKYLNRKEKIHPGDEFIVVDADSLPSA